MVLMLGVVDLGVVIYGVCDILHFHASQDIEYVQSYTAIYRPRLDPFLRLVPVSSDVTPFTS
jgi:hypothetical protein